MRTSIHTSLLLALLWLTHSASAQYNNGWIDYSKTYYKFNVGSEGLYRISYNTLQANGLASINADHFQLWRNGQEVPLFTSVSNRSFDASDFIEFFGQINDGKIDAQLYSRPGLQLADRWSLETDTAAYFLTVNSGTPNKRFTSSQNNIALNTLPAEPYFIHTLNRSFKDQLFPGYAAVVGSTFIYSSSYDQGEGWTSRYISPTTPLVEQSNLYVSSEGPAPLLRINAMGGAANNRRLQVLLNGTVVVDNPMNFLNASQLELPVPAGLLGRSLDTVRIINASTLASDRMVVHQYELVYSRTFNFGGASLFQFSLPASAVGNYLEISNFNAGGVAPILYELNEGRRYLGDLGVSGLYRFALPAGGERKFVIVSAAASAIQSVPSLQRKNFINYSVAAQHAEFLFITHSSLRISSRGDAIQQYTAYKSSANGGNYKTGVYDIEELTDQFAFGIKDHPIAIKQFIAFARNTFSTPLKYIFLVGKGVTYDQYRLFESRPITEKISLVPTFGNPGSDNILASSDFDPTPETPIGRLSVVSGDEILNYLDKVKEHDNALRSPVQTIEAKGWMKHVAHVIGGGDPYLQNLINGYMANSARIIEDSAFGGRVYSFDKITPAGIALTNSGFLSSLFKQGLALITYFGHSSASSMEYNLDDPSIFDNSGRYPLFIANGCNAGNFFTYDSARVLSSRRSITENYVLTPGKGSIGFLASTHLGIVNYLNQYTTSFYNKIARENYTATVGTMQTNVLNEIQVPTGTIDFYNTITLEQILLNGDPSIVLYPHASPDLVIEEPLIRVSPNNLNVTNSGFDLSVYYRNIGRVTRDSVRILIKRLLPDGTERILYNAMRPSARFADSISISVPIDPLSDKGMNRIQVNIDPDARITELSKSNNTAVKSFLIAEDDVRPTYPAQYAVVNRQDIKLRATTSKQLKTSATFFIEVDTTALFNSPIKFSQSQSSTGGVIDFTPGLPWLDSTVYYWRVAKRPDTGTAFNWATSSFTYVASGEPGWMQAHYYQFTENRLDNIESSRPTGFTFKKTNTELRIRTGLFPNGLNAVFLNSNILYDRGCSGSLNSIEFVVIDKSSGQPMVNVPQGTTGRFNSYSPGGCGLTKAYQFWYYYNTQQGRKNAMDFLDSIPAGSIVLLSNYGSLTTLSNPRFVNDWKSDTLTYGSGNSLYHKLTGIGFSSLDSFYRNIPFYFFAEKKSDGSWSPLGQGVGAVPSAVLNGSISFESFDNKGAETTGLIGPSLGWNRLRWDGYAQESPSNDALLWKVFGVKNDLSETLLFTSTSTRLDTAISFINARLYPQLRILRENSDPITRTPWQSRYLNVSYAQVPEGTVIPYQPFTIKDSVDAGERFRVTTSFRNISEVPFDSIKVVTTVVDSTNQSLPIASALYRPIIAGDSIVIDQWIETQKLSGNYNVLVQFNPDFSQPEQYLFNNYFTRSFKVVPDRTPPVLDVTFDGIRILNNDIVSAKPFIVIGLKDDSKFLALNDTALFKIRLRYPDGTIRNLKFDNDTLKLIPSVIDASGKENLATVHFRPYFKLDGEYELIVSAKDRSNNAAGSDYAVSFEVINKPMITQLLNYPNPFTTSTAFVFTLTGSEVPSQLTIQILTVTGKIVKEITRAELGPLRIGNNITEYKWDGRDQYGQPLGNGVYLYRVVATLNGKRLDQLNSGAYNIDRYFNSGYGKMYLMR